MYKGNTFYWGVMLTRISYSHNQNREHSSKMQTETQQIFALRFEADFQSQIIEFSCKFNFAGRTAKLVFTKSRVINRWPHGIPAISSSSYSDDIVLYIIVTTNTSEI